MLVLEVVLDLYGKSLQVREVHSGGRIGVDVCELLLQRGRHQSWFRAGDGRHGSYPVTQEKVVCGCVCFTYFLALVFIDSSFHFGLGLLRVAEGAKITTTTLDHSQLFAQELSTQA